MKFARMTLSLLALTVLAAAPNSAFAGRGLLDGGCGCSQKGGGCATQKGGCATQKGSCATQKSCGCATQKGGHVVQKGTVFQKSHVVQKGCGSKGCDSKGGSCGSCSICLPRVLPALLHGIDTVLNRVFCCDNCGAKSGCGCATQKGSVFQKAHIAQKGHVVQKGHVTQKGSDCGCSSQPSAPSNPFIDDLQPPPVLPDAASDARSSARREIARPVSQAVERPARSVIKTASSSSREPRTLPAELVLPADTIRGARTTVQAKPRTVIRTSATTANGLSVPTNPLR